MSCFTRTLNLGILKFFRSIKKFSLTFFSEGEIYSYEDFVVVVQAIVTSWQGIGGGEKDSICSKM